VRTTALRVVRALLAGVSRPRIGAVHCGAVVACLAFVAIAACKTTGPAPQPDPGVISREQDFRLRAECAAQAEKVVDQTAHEIESENRRDHDDDVAIVSSQNHYNEKLNRCFVLIYTVHRKTLGQTTQILDAFEHRVVVDCRGGLKSKTGCTDRENLIPGPLQEWPPEIPPGEAGRRIEAMLQQ
jgi:hypothetical protein